MNLHLHRDLCILGFALSALVAQTPLRLELAATGLDRPVLVTAPSGDTQRAFVVEKNGRIKILRNGIVLAQPFLDLATPGTVFDVAEMGMLGVAFHPQYATNRQFFVFYCTQQFPNVTLQRYTASAANGDVADPASAVTLLTFPLLYGNHNGGTIAFGADGKLYIAVGDGGSLAPTFPIDPLNNAQRGDSLMGKVLRIDVDTTTPPLHYGIPSDNPFVGPGDPRDEIWALGFRNPWRCSFDRTTGDFWIADVGGPREEIDFVAAGTGAGRNYGWSCMSGTVCTGINVCPCGSGTLTGPLHEYTLGSGQSIIGGYVYRGAAIPDLHGAYFFGDFVRNQIWSLRRQNGSVTDLRDRTIELLPPAGYALAGITSFGEDGNGELYVCSFDGNVYRIAANPNTLPGLAPFGVGTAGCNGSHALSSLTTPAQGNAGFALRCTNGIASGLGLIALASAVDVPGSDPFGHGMVIHFRLDSPYLSLQAMLCDANGIGTLALPIPADPVLVGQSIGAQAGFAWNPPCAIPPNGWSSSNGLWITVQP